MLRKWFSVMCRDQQSGLEVPGREREASDSQQSWPAAAAAGCALLAPPAARVSKRPFHLTLQATCCCCPCMGSCVSCQWSVLICMLLYLTMFRCHTARSSWKLAHHTCHMCAIICNHHGARSEPYSIHILYADFHGRDFCGNSVDVPSVVCNVA